MVILDWGLSCERYIVDQVLLEEQEYPVFRDMLTLIFIFVPCLSLFFTLVVSHFCETVVFTQVKVINGY